MMWFHYSSHSILDVFTDDLKMASRCVTEEHAYNTTGLEGSFQKKNAKGI